MGGLGENMRNFRNTLRITILVVASLLPFSNIAHSVDCGTTIPVLDAREKEAIEKLSKTYRIAMRDAQNFRASFLPALQLALTAFKSNARGLKASDERLLYLINRHTNTYKYEMYDSERGTIPSDIKLFHEDKMILAEFQASIAAGTLASQGQGIADKYNAPSFYRAARSDSGNGANLIGQLLRRIGDRRNPDDWTYMRHALNGKAKLQEARSATSPNRHRANYSEAAVALVTRMNQHIAVAQDLNIRLINALSTLIAVYEGMQQCLNQAAAGASQYDFNNNTLDENIELLPADYHGLPQN